MAEKNMARMYNTKKKRPHPRTKTYQDYRHHRKTMYVYGNECKYVRGLTNRKLRRTFKQSADKLNALRPVPHEYKTYGWITW